MRRKSSSDNSDENLERFEKTARNMNSLSKYSRSNAINKEWIDLYLNEAHSKGLTSVRCHCNIMAWSDNDEDLRRIKNDVGSQLATMGCMPPIPRFIGSSLISKWIGLPVRRSTILIPNGDNDER